MSIPTFPNDKQPPNSETCGPQSLANIYKSLHIEVGVDDIAEKTLCNEYSGSMLGHLALHALNQGLDAQYYSSNPFHVSPDWQGLGSQELSKKINAWMQIFPEDRANKKLRPICEYLDANGSHHIERSISCPLLDSLLIEGYVILAAIEESWLWGKRKVPGKSEYDGVKGHAQGHFVVVYGNDDKNYFISDPYPTGIPGRDGLYSIDKNTYLTSLIIYDAEFIAVKSK